MIWSANNVAKFKRKQKACFQLQKLRSFAQNQNTKSIIIFWHYFGSNSIPKSTSQKPQEGTQEPLPAERTPNEPMVDSLCLWWPMLLSSLWSVHQQLPQKQLLVPLLLLEFSLLCLSLTFYLFSLLLGDTTPFWMLTMHSISHVGYFH